MKYSQPEIVETSIEVKTRGRYITPSKGPRGLVIHYTAGHYGGSQEAKGTLINLADQGLGCLVMDTDGKIYRAKNQGMNDTAWHCGKSSWLGTSGLSRYLLGMEVCCAGKLSNEGRSWYGEYIPLKNRRIIASKTDNQKPGTYHAFTTLQEHSLINFCLWQLDVNQEFEIDWIVGHDEIAPMRKSDPGGSLSMSMPDFRDIVANLSNRLNV